MKQLTAMLCILTLLSACDVSFNKSPPEVTAITDFGTELQQQQVADSTAIFFKLLDAGKIEQTWTDASPLLKAITSEVAWVNGLKATRLGLESFKDRGPLRIGFTKQLPDAPAGNYAVVECVSTFSGSTIKENVYFRNEDQQWRVVGYNVNRRFSLSSNDKKAR